MAAFLPVGDRPNRLSAADIATRRVWFPNEPVPVRDGPGVEARPGGGTGAGRVSFAYSAARRALSNASFIIPAGKTVALVGTWRVHHDGAALMRPGS